MILFQNGSCKDCKVSKTEENTYSYFKKDVKKYYLMPRCKECHKVHMKRHRSSEDQYLLRAKYKEENKERYRELNRVNIKRSRKEKPYEWKLKEKMRMRVKRALDSSRVHLDQPIETIGCTSAFLRQHIERQFKEGMTWENKGEWNIDHIIPISAFDLTKKEHVQHCFHYSNLQPLWAIENILKYNTIPEPFSHIEAIQQLKTAS